MSLEISRRDVIKGAAITLLGLPGYFLYRASLGYYTPRPGMKALSSKQARIVEALAETLLGDGQALGISLAETHVVENVDDFLNEIPRHAHLRIAIMLWALEHVLPLRGFYLSRFSQLDPQDRRRLLEKLNNSWSLASRALVKGLKAFIFTAYFDRTPVIEKIELGLGCPRGTGGSGG